MKVVPKKQWHYPLGLERTYAKLLVAHVQRMFKVIQAFLPEMRDIILRYAVQLDADDLENIRKMFSKWLIRKFC